MKETSEEFSTAGRSVKIGLLASSVVSAWTWAATLLQSSSVAYDYGVSGPYWQVIFTFFRRQCTFIYFNP